jgi:hypothetical protein
MRSAAKHLTALAAAVLLTAVSLTAVLLTAVLLTVTAVHAAVPAEELLSPTPPDLPAPVANHHFLPGPDAAPPKTPLVGRLFLEGAAAMRLLEPPVKRHVLGRDVSVFPSVRLAFVSGGGRLLPLERDVVRAGSLEAGGSFWDLLVSPGWVWSQPGDGEWSRAAFAFSLVSSLENETHHGLATFLYDGEKTSAVRYQVVQQTAPYLVERPLVAWGRLAARFEKDPQVEARRAAALRAFERELADRLPLRPLTDLEVDVGLLAAIDGPAPDGVITSGLLVDGTLYLRPCRSPYGELPDCAAVPFGIWSVTKTIGNSLALMRLAEKLGPAVYDEPLLPWLPPDGVAAAGDIPPAWRKVQLGDALNMATGFGEGSAKTEPNNASDGYLVNYDAWYDEASAAGKVREVLQASVHPWGPGQVFRYRDQDHFLLGAALDGLVREKTADDLLGRLLQDGGRHGQHRILHAGKAAEALYRTKKRGLPHGEETPDGVHTYHMAFWHQPYRAAGGCVVDLSQMQGWGGHVVVLFPNGVVGLRIANGDPRDDRGASVRAMAAVADRLRPFCRGPG